MQLHSKAQSRFVFSVSGGITSQKFKNSSADIYDRLAQFRRGLYSWVAGLTPGRDYVQISDDGIGVNDPCGFGINDPRNFAHCEALISRQYTLWRDSAAKLFPVSSGWIVSRANNINMVDFKNVSSIGIEYYSRLNTGSVFLSNTKYPNFRVEILRGRIIDVSEGAFCDSKTLQYEISNLIEPKYIDILEAWDSATNPPTTKKKGLTLGLSGAYSQTLFPKASSQYGLYCGTEGFAEINPNAAKSNGFSIKEKEFGIRPFLGVEAKDKWMIYGLCGVKYCRKNIKSETLNCNKSKAAYEVGVGSDYVLSDKFLIGVKFIKTLKSTLKVKDLSFQTSSTKILFSLSYKVN